MQPTPPPPADRFALILGGICRVVAAHMRYRPADRPVLMLFWAYLCRRIVRFAALAERAPRRLPPTRPERPRATRRPGPPRLRLPSGFGWLLQQVPEAAPYSQQLHHLLAEPEMAALLAATPQAGRILRPLCRMLGVRPTPDLLPPAPRREPRTPSNKPAGRAAHPPCPATPWQPPWRAWSLMLPPRPFPAPA